MVRKSAIEKTAPVQETGGAPIRPRPSVHPAARSSRSRAGDLLRLFERNHGIGHLGMKNLAAVVATCLRRTNSRMINTVLREQRTTYAGASRFRVHAAARAHRSTSISRDSLGSRSSGSAFFSARQRSRTADRPAAIPVKRISSSRKR